MLTDASTFAYSQGVVEGAAAAASAAAYNYVYFDRYVVEGGHEKDEAAFRACFYVGNMAEDFSLPLLFGGVMTPLSSLWRTKPLVMEFGSFT